MICKRDGKFSALFLFFLCFFFFQGKIFSQYYSSRLFPNLLIYKQSVDTLSYSSSSAFYDHTYNSSINDTTLINIHHYYLEQKLGFPILNNNSFLTIKFKQKNNFFSFKEKNTLFTDQHFYSNLKQNIFSLEVIGKKKNLIFFSFYSYSTDNNYKNFKINFTIKHRGGFLQPEYNSLVKIRSGNFISDAFWYDLQIEKKYETKGITLGYKRNRIELQLKSLKLNPDMKPKFNYNGLGLNLARDGIFYDSQIKYISHKYSLWSRLHFYNKSTKVPIHWEKNKIGKFTAINDSLYSIQFGLDISSHQIIFGSGNWAGKIWVSQLYPRPFISTWPILAGTKYYLDTRSDMNFKCMSYRYRHEFNGLILNLNLQFLNLQGTFSGEQWAIIFPFINVLNDTLKVRIKKVEILESKLKLNKNFSNKVQAEIWSNFVLPLEFKTTSSLDTAPEQFKNQKITGGIQFGISITYIIK